MFKIQKVLLVTLASKLYLQIMSCCMLVDLIRVTGCIDIKFV